MNFSILSWNIRGLGRVEKRLQVKDIINSSSVDIVVLLETKLKSIPRSFLLQICHFSLVNGVCLLSRGPLVAFGLFGIRGRLKFSSFG